MCKKNLKIEWKDLSLAFWSPVRYIKNVDGFFGCYRGLEARLCQNIVSNTVYRRISTKCPWMDEKSANEPPFPQQYQLSSARSGAWIRAFGHLNEDFIIAVKKAGWDIVCVTTSALASQPFYVVAVRTMGQFVGRGNSYRSLFQSFKHIYETEGISGNATSRTKCVQG